MFARFRVLTAAGLAASLALAGVAVAMSPKPSALVKVDKNAPADCQKMDLAPYSTPQSLGITSATRKSLFTVEVASSESEREQGLMCRSALKPGEGMLFEFPDLAERNFWMHNTLIGLDIIYIGSDGRIVSIQKNAKPLNDTPLPSNGAATGVLEIPAGLSDKLGLQSGDKVEHPFFHGS